MKRRLLTRALTALPRLRPLYRRPVTYLDTNALSDLSRWRERASHIDGIEQVRCELCSCASKRTTGAPS